MFFIFVFFSHWQKLYYLAAAWKIELTFFFRFCFGFCPAPFVKLFICVGKRYSRALGIAYSGIYRYEHRNISEAASVWSYFLACSRVDLWKIITVLKGIGGKCKKICGLNIFYPVFFFREISFYKFLRFIAAYGNGHGIAVYSARKGNILRCQTVGGTQHCFRFAPNVTFVGDISVLGVSDNIFFSIFSRSFFFSRVKYAFHYFKRFCAVSSFNGYRRTVIADTSRIIYTRLVKLRCELHNIFLRTLFLW